MNEAVRSEKLIQSLRREILWLLIGYHAFTRKSQAWTLPQHSRMDIHDDMMFFEAMARDLILRLTRLDDDQSGVVSLRGVNKALRQYTRDQKWLSEIDGAIKSFRGAINSLKNQHRNAYLAHLRPAEDSAYRTPLLPQEFVHGVRKAVETMDIISEETVRYMREIGSQEGSVDLRDELGLSGGQEASAAQG